MNIALIEQLAGRMRVALEEVPRHKLPLSLSHFPAGSCGDVSLILGTYLYDNGLLDFDYISGNRGSRKDNTWTTHAWLACGNLVVDITADQFPDAPSKVIVAKNSDWHKQFDVLDRYPSNFRDWSGPGTHHLHSMYALLRPALFDV